MRKPVIAEAKTVAGVHTHTHTHTHTGSVSGYLTYKKIIEKMKTHVFYKYFGVPKYG